MCMYSIGNTLVYVGEPSAVEKVFRNEGKNPSRSIKMEDTFEWIFKSRNEDPVFSLTYSKLF